jgi:endoribonuclease Dicer
MEQAKSENLIVCLPTGSGKTFIAVMLIKELSPITRRSLKDNGKRTIVLVKTGIINLALSLIRFFFC